MQQLGRLKMSVLRQRAAAAGVPAMDVAAAVNAGHRSKALLVALLERYSDTSLARMTADTHSVADTPHARQLPLQALPQTVLERRARYDGASVEELADAMDDEEPVTSVVELIRSKRPAAVAARAAARQQVYKEMPVTRHMMMELDAKMERLSESMRQQIAELIRLQQTAVEHSVVTSGIVRHSEHHLSQISGMMTPSKPSHMASPGARRSPGDTPNRVMVPLPSTAPDVSRTEPVRRAKSPVRELDAAASEWVLKELGPGWSGTLSTVARTRKDLSLLTEGAIERLEEKLGMRLQDKPKLLAALGRMPGSHMHAYNRDE